MLIRVRDTEACEPLSTFIWDSIWVNRPDASGGYADWIMAGADDPAEQRGGLRARMMLPTAILIQVFTDRRLGEGERPPGDSTDPRGWWGDSIKLPGEPEAPTGSLLWTLERHRLDADTARLAKDIIEEALQPILDQGAVQRFEVETWAEIPDGFLAIIIRGFGHAGAPVFNNTYQVLWNQALTPAPMNFGERF